MRTSADVRAIALAEALSVRAALQLAAAAVVLAFWETHSVSSLVDHDRPMPYW